MSSTESTTESSSTPAVASTTPAAAQPLFNPFAALASPAASTTTESTDNDGGDGEVAPEEESTAQYTPLVKLEAVEVKTGEEDDEVLYTQRAALYRFDAGEWKERGKGDVKLLQNKHNQKVRILMRQEKTLKLCMNHFVHPDLPLKANAGSDRSWTWRVRDYAGEEPEGKDETFAIRFRDADIANAFKAKLEEVKAINAELMKKA